MSPLALLRAHVLVVAMPGRPLLRLRAEAAVRARGWVVTSAPVDADLLLVCGRPAGELAEAVDALWARVPVPRARRTVRSAQGLAEALDSAARVLGDGALQRRAAADLGPAPAPEVAGRLGPLGPCWPSGLLVECAVEGGAVAAVGVRRLAGEIEDDPFEHGAFVLAVADAARLLRLAGWAVPAARLDRVIDLALSGVEPLRLRPRLARVGRTVRRSATFRWGIARDLPSADLRARVLALLDAALAGTDAPAADMRSLVGERIADLPMLVAVREGIGG